MFCIINLSQERKQSYQILLSDNIYLWIVNVLSAAAKSNWIWSLVFSVSVFVSQDGLSQMLVQHMAENNLHRVIFWGSKVILVVSVSHL